MKIIKIAFLLTFVICQTNVYSQKKTKEVPKNIKITTGEPYQVVDSHMKWYFHSDNKILSIKGLSGGKKFIFQVFNKETMNEIQRREKIMDEPGYIFEAILKMNNQLFLFYNLYDKVNTTEQLFVQEISLETGEFIDSPKNILKIPEKVKSVMGHDKFNFDLSSDKSKFVIKYRYLDESKIDVKNISKIGLATFNSEMEMLAKHDITMPDIDAKINQLDFTVDSKGNSYFLLRKKKEITTPLTRGSVQNNPDNFSISIIKADIDGQVNESEIAIKDYLIEGIILKENENNEIVCAGYYRLPKAYGIKGIFIAKLNKNGEVESPVFHAFSLELIAQYSKGNEKKVKKMEEQEEKAGIRSLELQNIVMLKGGGILLTGHIFYIVTHHTKDGTTTTTHHNDIILTKINANNELEWMKRIPKRSTFEAFRLFYSNNNAYVVFTDNLKNEALPTNMTPQKASRKGPVVAYKLSLENGSTEYSPMFKRDMIDGIPVYQFDLYRLNNISESSFILELYVKKKQDRMFRIDFQD